MFVFIEKIDFCCFIYHYLYTVSMSPHTPLPPSLLFSSTPLLEILMISCYKYTQIIYNTIEEAVSESFFSVVLAKELHPPSLSKSKNRRKLGKNETIFGYFNQNRCLHGERGETTPFFLVHFCVNLKGIKIPPPNYKELLFCDKNTMLFFPYTNFSYIISFF